MCQSFLVTNFDRVDDHFEVIGKYDCFAGFHGRGICISFNGLVCLPYMPSANSGSRLATWESWLQDFFHELLGSKAVDILIDVMRTLKDVETLEGLRPGEEVRGYYSLWALNISLLAPESLPRWGPLNDVIVSRSKYIRLVNPGSP